MRKALIVGINDYPNAKLNGCIKDATSFATIIETNGNGSPNFDIKLETDIQTKSELKGLVRDLFTGKSDLALFYFSGHGHTDDTGGYIVTPDYKANDVGVSMDEILVLANASEAENKVIILDCCYSGILGSPKIAGGKTAQIAEGVTILTASKPDETSLEVNGHGVFTNLLLNAIRGGAADLRGEITPGSVYAYIDQALGAWDQRPVFKTNITRFTSLRTVVPQVPIEILRKLIEYFPSPQDEFALDPSYEDTNDPTVDHKFVKPHAVNENVAKFKHLQKYQSVGLVVPKGEQYMYFAAMNSKSCTLTALGYHYWRLVNDKRI